MRNKLMALIAAFAFVVSAAAGISPARADDAKMAASISIPNVGHWQEAKAPGKWRFSGSDKKSPAPSPFTGPGYYHVGASEVLTGTDSAGGTSSKMYVAKPFIPAASCVSGGDHSLMELAMRDTAGNVVEVGWAAEPSAFGDCKPRLFASTWKGNGSGGATWNGCYDAHAASCYFIDNSSNPIDLGADLTSVANLCAGVNLNCVKVFQAYWSASSCGPASSGIIITYDGSSVGCFYSPAFYNNITPSSWTVFQGFGEVYYSGPTKPCTDMGNGIAPTVALGATGPAYIGPVAFANPSPATLTTAYTAQTSTDGPAYDVGSVLGGKTFATSGRGYTWNGSAWVTPGLTNAC